MFERIEQFGASWYGLLFLMGLPVLVVLAPLLVGNQVLYWGDDVIHAAAYFSFFSQALHSGESFLWNPGNFSGFPVFATVFGFFAPWNYAIAWLIENSFAFIRFLPWWTLLIFTLGAFFFARLGQGLGLSFWSAYVAGLAFTLSHQTDAFLPPVINLHLFVPLLFFVFWRIAQSRSWWWALIGVGAIAFGWLAVNFQDTFYTLLAVSGWVGFLGWRLWREASAIETRHFLVQCLLVFVGGTIIGLVQILPTQLMAVFSTRSAGLSYALAAEDALLPTDFLRWLIPDVRLPLGIPFGSAGANSPMYLGIVPLFFFVYALWSRARPLRFFQALFWLGLAVSVLYSPLFWLMTKLPIFSYFRVPDRWMIFALFAAALLAGFGMERFLKNIGDVHESSAPRRLLKIFTWLAAAVGTALVAANVMLWFFRDAFTAFAKTFFENRLYGWYQPVGAVPIAHYFAIIERYVSELARYVSFSEPIVLMGFLSLVVSVVVLWRLVLNPPRSPKVAALILAATTLVNFMVVKVFDYNVMPRRTHQEIPATIAFLKEHPGKALQVLHEDFEEAVVTPQYRPALADKFLYRAAMLVPNTNLLYNVESAVMKDGLEPLNMARLMRLVGARVITPPEHLPGEFPITGLNPPETLARRKPLLEFLGIRYLISGYPLDEIAFKRVFSGTVSAKKIPLSVYENENARPLVSTAELVTFMDATDTDVFRAFEASNFSGIFAACRPPFFGRPSGGTPCVPGMRTFGSATLDIRERENGLLSLSVGAREEAFLIFSQNHLPGWRVFVDGAEAEISTVNTVFMGIKIPAGEHDVRFEYRHPCLGSGFMTCVKALWPQKENEII